MALELSKVLSTVKAADPYNDRNVDYDMLGLYLFRELEKTGAKDPKGIVDAISAVFVKRPEVRWIVSRLDQKKAMDMARQLHAIIND